MNKNLILINLKASLTVYLVALPLALGVSIASEVPPIYGLISSVIGGILVGYLSGAPLQVSGAAAGLVVIVHDIVDRHGLSGLAIATIVAGAFQLSLFKLKLGKFFSNIPQSVSFGMLGGIGGLICLSQFFILFDLIPYSSGLDNLKGMGKFFLGLFTLNLSPNIIFPAVISISSLFFLNSWKKISKFFPKLLSAPIIICILSALIVRGFSLNTKHLNLDQLSLDSIFSFFHFHYYHKILDFHLWLEGIELGLIASVETLLTVGATDKLHSLGKSNFDRELKAQGIGNLCAGFFGALPITGVVVRTTANIDAGATGRSSTIFHGILMLVSILYLTDLISLIPLSALGAILFYTGIKLINVKFILKLFRENFFDGLTYMITFLTIIFVNLLVGVILGLVFYYLTSSSKPPVEKGR